MARGKGGLGRGLDSLFEDVLPAGEGGNGVETIPLRDIEPDPNQPRKTFSEESIAELAQSITEHGLLQPIVVRSRLPGRYIIIAGERRWRACRLAGLTEVPVIVREVTEEQAMELALIENLQREDLNPVEQAQGIRALMKHSSLTQEQAARRLGVSRSAVANMLRMLGLPEPVLDRLAAGGITAGHAKVLLSLPDEAMQCSAAQVVEEESLNVRQTEVLCKKLMQPETPPSIAPRRPSLPTEVELSLRETLGNEVKVAYKKGKGSLTVHFYSDEQLRAFANLLGGYTPAGEK